ncbi:NAD-dependent succinate-semialdehyde dehydrogenase [Variovorax guangxiensis]|uniref:NAD-dependent succinate-semialdehyde dehydrogenase n=1 Tax=Variovorax guangxiensis TaxID=1775474 RepID=UPI0028601FEA|nr:NAD-dependent succinate-semialdehyde dehydrogenase [Variovorax guangxiensis]MDR6858749.1 succinate-semialdehyde dehydrogenase/glutarate-semialdehyde dehydrogenase [Variovorax guangxiensis]
MVDQRSNRSATAHHADYPRVGLFIDGNWIHDRPTLGEVINPSTEAVLGKVPQATDADLQRALGAAARGYLTWRDTPPKERVRVIAGAVALLHKRKDFIAKVLTLENGKPISHAHAEIDRSLNFYEWEMGQAVRAYGCIVPSAPQMQKLVMRQPIGPVFAATPWNGPMASLSRKISAALAAGCSVILKPAEETPGTACEVVRCFEEAGLPPGVLNLVLGEPAHISSTLIASPVIRMVTFTGSVQVGKHLTQLAAQAMKPALMELGGHAPVLVGESINIAQVAKLAAITKTRAAGQICTSPSRFIVHRRAYPEFVDCFARSLGELRVGDGLDPTVDIGPVANSRRLAAAEALVEDARSRGARVVAGGQRVGSRGFFFAPTLLADVPPEADVMTSEPFCPLAACVPATDLDEALAIANSLPFGLAGYAFTNSLEEAEQITRRLECGMVSINHFDTPDADTPFGGVKQSGIGREGGPSSLDAYLATKTVLQNTARV